MKTIYEKAVLDHGYVKLVGVLGDDLTGLEAARMSTGNPTGVDEAKDDALRARLWRDGHTSPSEMNVACFEFQLPMFVLRQFDRHRTLDIANPELVEDYDEFRKYTSRNEFSGRYSVMPELFYIPAPERIQKQSTTNKQGSGEPFTDLDQDGIHATLKNYTQDAAVFYRDSVESGIANELARITLPQNQYTKIRIQASMQNWFRFLQLRLPAEVQWETRQYAEAVAAALQQVWPKSFGVWEEYTRDALTLSRTECGPLMLAISDISRHVGLQATLAELIPLLEMRGFSEQRRRFIVARLIRGRMVDEAKP